MGVEVRDQIMAAAASYVGVPYAMPPGPGELDCSSYVLQVYGDVGLPFAAGVRTAEQIRQQSQIIEWDDVQRADIVFFEHTYEPSEPPGPDGHTASHVGISLGAGSFQMFSAQEPCVQLTDISTAYWQDHLFEARRAPALVATDPPVEEAAASALGDPWPNSQPPLVLVAADGRTLTITGYTHGLAIEDAGGRYDLAHVVADPHDPDRLQVAGRWFRAEGA